MTEIEEKTAMALPVYCDRLNSERSKELYTEIVRYFKKERRYRNHDEAGTCVSAVAKALGTNRRYISAAILKETGSNFNALLNRLRFAELERMMLSAKYDGLSLEELAVMCGFRTRQCFHSAFRKAYGKTPAAHREVMIARRNEMKRQRQERNKSTEKIC